MNSRATPSVLKRVVNVLLGVSAIALGLGLVYLAIASGVVGEACADETLTCVLKSLNWGAVASLVGGGMALITGGWILLKPVYVAIGSKAPT